MDESTQSSSLPEDAELFRLRKQAKLFLKDIRARDQAAIALAATHHPQANIDSFRLSDAQLVVARSYGFASWPRLAAYVQSLSPTVEADPVHYKTVFEAVKQGNISKVMTMIEADETVLDIADSRQITPLTVAFAYQQIELALALIERGANVFAMNHSDKWGMRTIVESNGLSAEDRKRFVDAVIEARVWGEVIFHAVWQRDISRAKAILNSDPKKASIRLAVSGGENGFYNSLPYCGLTPMHYAVMAGDEPMVRVLLEAGAEVDAIPYAHESDSRHTPLYLVPEGCDSIAELLIQHGADVNHSTSYLVEGSKSMREIIVSHGAGGTPLMAALTIGDFDKATKLIREDRSVILDRIPGSRIETPLHLAVKVNSIDVVELLIEQGMSIDTPTSKGYTALSLAPEMYCSLEMIKRLVELGADVRAGNDSPMRAAVWQHAYGHWEYEDVIRYLAEQGSLPRGIWHCANGGNVELMKLLIELGGDVNETDEFGFYSMPIGSGNTALDYCTGVVGEHQHPEIAELLRQHGGKHASELGSA